MEQGTEQTAANQQTAQETQAKQEENKAEDNVVFVGTKPLVNYIRGVIAQFSKWNKPEVVIKARGKFISKAVDVAEVARRSLEGKGVSIKEIKIATESFESDGKQTNISTIDIVLGK
ncbi:DNA-binding protein Alba [Candidatus Pacearchaeota archaeon]|nr:MAG: DNA-binding protein Alba [Candidatus Pacearchaeota archaeon]